MRSSPSATDALFAGTAGFAHRGLHGSGVPENSLAAFRAAIAAGAGIECDLRLSRDGFAMVFHDASLKRLCGLAVETESLHAAALMDMRLGDTAEKIPWLGALLDLVGGQAPLLLELKTRGTVSGAYGIQVPIDRLCHAVADQLARYRGPVGVMSFDPRIGQWFDRHAPDIPRGLVIDAHTPPWRRWAMVMIANPQFLAISHTDAAARWVARWRRRNGPVGSWTIRDPGTSVTVAKSVDALIWEGDGRPRT